jgi:hypothetical protein
MEQILKKQIVAQLYSQEIPCNLWDPKVPPSICNRTLIRVHILKLYFFKIQSDTVILSTHAYDHPTP